jgi:hypothetical protein
LPDISITTMTGERIFPYRWTHRTRAGCIHQSRVGWSGFPILAVCITTMNGWPRNWIDGRSVTWRATSYREGQGLVVVFNHHCDATAIEDSVLRVAPLRRIRTALKDAPVLPASLRRHLA